jgi:hypothetical protein
LCVGGLSNLFLSTQHEGEEPLQVFQGTCGGLLANGGDFVIGQIRDKARVLTNFGNNQVAEMFQQVVTESPWVVAVLVEFRSQPQGLGRLTRQYRVHNAKESLSVGDAERLAYGLLGDSASTPGNNLIE